MGDRKTSPTENIIKTEQNEQQQYGKGMKKTC